MRLHSFFLRLPPNVLFQAGPQSSAVNHIIPLSPYASLDKMLGIMLLFTLSGVLVGTPLLKVSCHFPYILHVEGLMSQQSFSFSPVPHEFEWLQTPEMPVLCWRWIMYLLLSWQEIIWVSFFWILYWIWLVESKCRVALTVRQGISLGKEWEITEFQ